MRTRLLITVLGTMLIAAQVQADDQKPLSQKEKTAYAIGVDLIRNFKKQGIDTDLAAVIRGMQAEGAGAKLLLSEPELAKTIKEYNIDLMSKQALLKQQAAEKNKKDGAEFLAANKVKQGVVTTASGLQYKIIKAGSGNKPGDEDGVTCRYRGTLLDGTEFDNSDYSGFTLPVTFYVKDSVIDGWKEALKLMPAGSKWQIFVPSGLAFGEKGAGRTVGPNATIIYEIELLAVNPQAVIPKKKETHDDHKHKQ